MDKVLVIMKIVRQILMTIGPLLVGIGIATPEQTAEMGPQIDAVTNATGVVITAVGSVMWIVGTVLSWAKAIKAKYLVKKD